MQGNAFDRKHGNQGAPLAPPGAIHRFPSRTEQAAFASSSSAATSVAQPQTQAQRSGGVVPVRVLDAFYQLLPHPSVQQVVRSYSAYFNPQSFQNAGDSGVIALYTPPEGSVLITTDLQIFATAPGSGLQSPSVALDPRSLLGSLEFRVTVGGTSPLAIETGRPRLYRTTDPGHESLSSGWGKLESLIGSSRGFALYARGQRQLAVTVALRETGQAPRFVLSSIGAECQGYTVSESIFDRLWLRLSSEGTL